jgi:hypothetical protein
MAGLVLLMVLNSEPDKPHPLYGLVGNMNMSKYVLCMTAACEEHSVLAMLLLRVMTRPATGIQCHQ